MASDNRRKEVQHAFAVLLKYHIGKLEHLIVIDPSHSDHSRFMLLALQTIQKELQDGQTSVETIQDCLKIMQAGQLDEGNPRLKNELINEIMLFKLRYDLN